MNRTRGQILIFEVRQALRRGEALCTGGSLHAPRRDSQLLDFLVRNSVIKRNECCKRLTNLALHVRQRE